MRNCVRSGVLLVDKPKGFTSHDVVQFVRKNFGFKKVGHAGTLDPMATGLLIILLGDFTKKSASLSGLDKEYEAELCMGVSTDSGDSEGIVTGRSDVDGDKYSVSYLEDIFNSFFGRISQVPPMFSAKKINGKKLYELARKGITLKRDPRIVFIRAIRIINVSFPRVTFYVKCSKGTYVRQLAHDIGEKAGCGAHLTSLRRIKIGSFDLRDAISLEKLKEALKEARSIEQYIYEDVLQS